MHYPLPEDLEEIVFLTLEDILTIHEAILDEGQIPGVKNQNDLDSAIGRVQSAAYYDYEADLVKLAAYYWHGISANHGFHDGNKRAGFVAMTTFLDVNGLEFMGSDDEMGPLIYSMFEENRFTLEALEDLVRRNTRPLV